MKKKNTRVEGKTVKVKRQDIRIPLDFYNRLKQIAVKRFNAPIHHRSKEPAITPTLLKLAELGIEYLESGLADKKTEIATTEIFKRLENLEQSQSDNNTDNFTGQLADRIKIIEQKIADNNTDKIAKKVLKRIENIEQRLNDINTDKFSKELVERLEVVENRLADNSQTIPIELEQEKPLSPQTADSNDDNIEDFYSGVKEVFSTSNDPDGSDKSAPIAQVSPDQTDKNLAPIATVEETGLTDEQLADEFGVNTSVVRRWRTGASKPRGNNLKRLKQWEVRGDRWFPKTKNN